MKGRICAISVLIGAMVLSVQASLALPDSFPRGDVNQDGLIDVADALLLQRHLTSPSAGILNERGLFEADLAPLISGVTTPDDVVGLADLMVLLRLLKRELGPVRPTLDPIPPSTLNPIPTDIEGDGPPNATIHLFVMDGTSTFVHVDTVTSNALGEYSFSGVPKLFDGVNKFFAVAEDASGLASEASIPQVTSHTNATAQTHSSLVTISAVQVWTAHSAGAYNVNGGIDIAATGTLILGPGATLRFATGKSLAVNGVLKVYGAPTRKVVLTAGTTAGATWLGVDISPAATVATTFASHVSHARVEKVAEPQNSIEVDPSSAAVANLVLRDSEVVTASTNVGGIRSILGNASITMEWTTVQGPTPGSGLRAGVNLDRSFPPSRISHSRITGFGIGLDLSQGSQHRVEYTTIDSCRVGLEVLSNNSLLFPNNWIHTNTTAGISLLAFPGVANEPDYYASAYAFPRLRDSRIEHNGTAPAYQGNVRMGGTGFWFVDPSDPSGSPNPGTNEDARALFDASGNYWGFETAAQIEASINHVTDQLLRDSETGHVGSNTKGVLVDFTPFRHSSGTLDYSAVSGHMDNDFGPDAPALPLRTAIGPMLLRAGGTATIPAGTLIKAYVPPPVSPTLRGPRVDVLVHGTLIVAGTPGTGQVEFSAPGASPERGDWWGLRFTDTSTASQLSHVRIRDAYEAIHAKQTDIEIDAATITLFEKGGIVLESVTPLSSVANSIIDGLVQVGPPEVTLKSLAHQSADADIFGLRVIDSFDGCSATPGSCGALSNNTIRKLVTGIHLVGASDPEILDNTLTDNVWGIWLQASPSGQPLPVMHLNTIANNSGTPPSPLVTNFGEEQFRFCSTLSGSNLCLSNYANFGTTVIDAKENDWGSIDPTVVRGSVDIAEGQRVAVDVSKFTDSGGSIIGPVSGVFSSLLVDILRSSSGNSLVNAVLRPPAEMLNIQFSLVDSANVVLEVFPEGTPASHSAGTALYTNNLGLLGPGAHSTTWNGKDGSLDFVPDGAYSFVLTATGASIVDRYDPPRNSGQFSTGTGNPPPIFMLIGDVGSGSSPGGAPFNSFENDYLSLSYTLSTDPIRAKPFAARVSAQVIVRATSTTNCGVPATAGTLVARPWIGKPLWIGAHDFIWDGRGDQNAPEPLRGQILTQQLHGFCVFFESTLPLQPNHVIVDGTSLEISGVKNGTPQLEVLSDPFLIHPTYEQSTTLRFKVHHRPAMVVLHILPPGQTALSAAVSSTPIDGDTTVAGVQPVPADVFYTYEWKAHPVTSGNTNLLETSVDGSYTFALEATVDGEPQLSTTYRGVVQVHGH